MKAFTMKVITLSFCLLAIEVLYAQQSPDTLFGVGIVCSDFSGRGLAPLSTEILLSPLIRPGSPGSRTALHITSEHFLNLVAARIENLVPFDSISVDYRFDVRMVCLIYSRKSTDTLLFGPNGDLMVFNSKYFHLDAPLLKAMAENLPKEQREDVEEYLLLLKYPEHFKTPP